MLLIIVGCHSHNNNGNFYSSEWWKKSFADLGEIICNLSRLNKKKITIREKKCKLRREKQEFFTQKKLCKLDGAIIFEHDTQKAPSYCCLIMNISVIL